MFAGLFSFDLLLPLLIVLVAIGAGFGLMTAKAAKTPRGKEANPALALVDLDVAPLLNKSETRLLLELEALLRDNPEGYRVFAQVSLGEIFKIRARGLDRRTYRSAHNTFNAKRVDFLIVDHKQLPVLGIEYQGKGHAQGNAAARDAAKRAVFERAGVPLMEVAAMESWADTQAAILTHLPDLTDEADDLPSIAAAG